MNSHPRRRHLHALPEPPASSKRDEPRFKPVTRIGSGALDPLPESIRLEMARAADLWDSLEADGKQLRYEIDETTGRVSAELRDHAGRRLRAVPLTQALGTDDDDSPAA